MNHRPRLLILATAFGLIWILPSANESACAQTPIHNAVTAHAPGKPSDVVLASANSRERLQGAYPLQNTVMPVVQDDSRDAAERVKLLIEEIEEAENHQRLLLGSACLGISTYYGILSGTYFVFRRRLPDVSRAEADLSGGITAGIGALFLLYGGYTVFRPWTGERLAADYRAALGAGDSARALALVNDRLPGLTSAETLYRWVSGITGALTALLSATGLVVGEIQAKEPAERLKIRTVTGPGVIAGLAMVGSAILIESPLERLVNVLQRNPDRLQLEPAIAPTRGGVAVGLNGWF
jgi:hypothetical protein